jgi:hypothetical protein
MARSRVRSEIVVVKSKYRVFVAMPGMKSDIDVWKGQPGDAFTSQAVVVTSWLELFVTCRRIAKRRRVCCHVLAGFNEESSNYRAEQTSLL